MSISTPVTLHIDDEPEINTTLEQFFADNEGTFNEAQIAEITRVVIRERGVFIGCEAAGWPFAIYAGHHA